MEKSEFSILKIYASTTDKIKSRLLHEYVVLKAKEFGISGITINRGIMGYGLSSKIQSSKFWELTEKLPVTIEIMEKTTVLEDFFRSVEGELRQMQKGCVAVIFPVSILLQMEGPGKK